MIVSNLPDMSQIVSTYKIGEILKDRTPTTLSKLILEMEEKNYSQSLSKAKNKLTWQSEKEQLLNLINSVK